VPTEVRVVTNRNSTSPGFGEQCERQFNFDLLLKLPKQVRQSLASELIKAERISVDWGWLQPVPWHTKGRSSIFFGHYGNAKAISVGLRPRRAWREECTQLTSPFAPEKPVQGSKRNLWRERLHFLRTK
jgi:hypothetical protein